MFSLHPLRTARHRGLLVAAAASAAALVLQASCGDLQPEIDQGSAPSSGSSSGSPSGCTSTFAEKSTDTVIVIDAGLPDAMAKIACGDSTEQLSHTRGVGLDITRAVGYNPDPTIPSKAAALLPPGDKSAAANQMRGTPPTSGGQQQFNDIYRTLDDPTNLIKGTLFRDGPRGVNLLSPVYTGAFGSAPVNYGPGYATVFPVTMARGATWDLDLEAQIGSDLADEVLASGNTLTISPCVNLLRHPAWGRAQETYGEDTFAVGRMGTAYTDGVQEYIPACVKHLAAYDVENGRFNQNAILDSQTLHEIFGRHFEMIVQEAGVACVMASYNSIQVSDLDNVSYKDTSNPLLLNGMLRGTFQFKGFVMSDFWAMPGFQTTNLMPSQYATNAQNAINAGLDMEMPWSLNFANIEAVATQQQLTDAAMRILEQKLRFKVAAANGPLGLKPPTTSFGTSGIICNDGHIADAEAQAEEAMVLLKNDGNTLPIDRSRVHKIAVIGASVPWTLSGTGQSSSDMGAFKNFATDARIGDLGSSRVGLDPSKAVGPAAGITAAAGGGIMVMSGTDPNLADSADFVVVVAGLTPEDEGEEYTGAGDRIDSSGNPNLGLDPKSGSNVQNTLITAVAAKKKPMVVVIEAGSGVNMPWLGSVPAVVMAWYPGQSGGTALGRLLFGDANFSGKLPITWPKSEADFQGQSGTGNNGLAFNQGGTTGGSTTMGYYLGYRYFDKNNLTPLFAFGSGLSYTTFKYEFLGVPCSTVSKNGVVDVQVAVTNTGAVPGNEVTFLFVSYPKTTARRSVKELKGFHRTSAIQPGQTVTFTIPLRIQDLKYWNSTANPPGWTVESGPVQIMVGPSSDNLLLKDMLTVQ